MCTLLSGLSIGDDDDGVGLAKEGKKCVFNMLGKNYSKQHFEIFSYISQKIAFDMSKPILWEK